MRIWQNLKVTASAIALLAGTYAEMRALLSVAEALTANRTYYVNGSTGSDSNTGLSSGTAFATITKAIAVVASLNLAGYTATISVAAGTYTAQNILPTLTAGGSCIIVGDETTPSNVTVSVTGTCFKADGVAGLWQIRGFKLVGSSYGIECINNSTIKFQNCDFGACNQQIRCAYGGIVEATGNYSISAGAASHISILYGGIAKTTTRTVTITNTPAFSYYFVNCNGGQYEAHSMTFSGSATGPRYVVTGNGTVNTAGGGASYFPGDSSGLAIADKEYA